MLRQILSMNVVRVIGTFWNYTFKLTTRYEQLSKIKLFGLCYANALTFQHDKYVNGLKRATEEGENYLSQLVCMLRTLILETSIEYQECLIKQIELTKKNSIIGPVGEHWDILTDMRVKAYELKDELNKYEALAKNLEDIIVEQSHLIMLDNADSSLSKLNLELDKLKRLRKKQSFEILRYEKELLEANRDSILTVDS